MGKTHTNISWGFVLNIHDNLPSDKYNKHDKITLEEPPQQWDSNKFFGMYSFLVCSILQYAALVSHSIHVIDNESALFIHATE